MSTLASVFAVFHPPIFEIPQTRGDYNILVTPRASTSPLHAWILAFRPRTLFAAAAPVAVGTAVAIRDGGFALLPALAALLGALLLQVGSNLANDVFDFQRGADAPDRVGPLRVTQTGLLTPAQVLRGMWVVFALSLIPGLYLAARGGWPVVAIGITAIAAAVLYTGGPLPYGYKGMGEIFVFVFFGPVAVSGTYYVQTNTLTLLAIAASVPIGLLTSAILVVNNLRDIGPDRAVGKTTLAVLLGARGTRIEYLLLLGLAFAAPPALFAAGLAPPWVMIAWISAPLAERQARIVITQSGAALNAALAGTALLTLAYSLLFAAGLTVQ